MPIVGNLRPCSVGSSPEWDGTSLLRLGSIIWQRRRGFAEAIKAPNQSTQFFKRDPIWMHRTSDEHESRMSGSPSLNHTQIPFLMLQRVFFCLVCSVDGTQRTHFPGQKLWDDKPHGLFSFSVFFFKRILSFTYPCTVRIS